VQLSKCDGLVHAAHARLRVIAEYSLLGGGIWNMMRPFSQLWLLLDGLFELS
jgi:spore germination protein